MYMMNSYFTGNINVDARACIDKDGTEFRYSNVFYPEGQIVLNRYVSSQALHIGGPSTVRLVIIFIIDDVLDFLYKTHGNGD